MRQQTFSDIEYSNRRKKTRREIFLESMDGLLPWESWVGMIRPHYFKNTRGRRARDLEVMLRMYLLQQWFHLTDEGTEEAIYDSYAMRRFLGIDFLDEQTPDATTLGRFRHLMERHCLGETIRSEMAACLEQAGLILYSGAVADAMLVHSPEKE